MDDCTDTNQSLDPRDARALTEAMTVLHKGGDVYTVVGENGSTYTVDGREERCTCPDAEHNLPTDDGREACKHLARVQYATGMREIPSGVSFAAVDPLLGEHVGHTPVVATDGGLITAECTPSEGDEDDSDVRPDDCECTGHERESLPCWPCYAAGYETPADS